MPIPATIHDEPRAYSNGAEHVPADHMTWSGALVATDFRTLDDFYVCQSGFLDAPDFLAAGSVVAAAMRNGRRGAVGRLALRAL